MMQKKVSRNSSVTTKAVNHPKPPETIRNHLLPVGNYPKPAVTSLKLPNTTQKQPSIALD